MTGTGTTGRRRAVLGGSSVVCAVVPHYRCEEWLGQALESLLDQTRPPDSIVVVDDGSPRPPVDVVRRYPSVTLLAADDNGGPYRLVQAVIDQVRADAFLFQDADDWSSNDRLEVLLDVAAATGAELVGSHEVRVLVDDHAAQPVRYPLDVNATLDAHPTAFPLLHPTSLIGRQLVHRLGGFSTGMRFSGDEELLRRAAHAARVVNADHFGYFRRKRAGSLTTDTATALDSPARRAVQTTLGERARANAHAVARGRRPDLRPWRTAPAPRLRHVTGPAIETGRVRSGRPHRVGRAVSSGGARTAAERSPVFVVGAPRAGHEELGWALAQHAAIRSVSDPTWVASVAAAVAHSTLHGGPSVPTELAGRTATALLDLAAPDHRPLMAGAELVHAVGALATLWPDARFVHVVRDPDEVVSSLAHTPVDGGTLHSPDLASARWFDAVENGLALERALGDQVVLRVRHDHIGSDPGVVVEQVLAFIGETADPRTTGACRRTLAALAARTSGAADPRRHDHSASPWLVERARRRWHTLDTPVPPTGDHERCEQALARLVRATAGDDVRGASSSGRLVDEFRRLVAATVPHGGDVAVISRGDPALLPHDGRDGRHFPCDDAGAYLGYHPADSAAALDHLDAHRAGGGTHLAVPATAMWWLDHYDGLREHLGRRCRLVAYVESVGAVWDIVDGPRDDARDRGAALLIGSAG